MCLSERNFVLSLAPFYNYSLKLYAVTFPLMSRFLTYIGDLCVSKGTAIQRVQAMVCEVVLKDFNADVLMTLRYVHTYMLYMFYSGSFERHEYM